MWERIGVGSPGIVVPAKQIETNAFPGEPAPRRTQAEAGYRIRGPRRGARQRNGIHGFSIEHVFWIVKGPDLCQEPGSREASGGPTGV